MTASKIHVCACSRFTYNCWVNNNRPVGGAERDLTNIMRCLTDTGEFDFTLISETLGDPLPDDGIVNAVRIRNAGLPRIARFRVLRPLAYLVYIIRLLWQTLTVRTDIFFAKGCSVAMLVMWFAAKLRRKPCVFRYASISELDKNILYASKSNRGRIALKLFDVAIRSMTQCIAQTTDQAKIFESRYGRRIQVIYNMLGIAPLADMELAPSLATRDTILWLGRCHSVKRPELFLELARALPQYQFVMVAPEASGEEDFAKEISAQAEQLSNLNFVRGVTPDEVVQYYRQARVFIMTSVYEGFSNTMAESFSQGTPVISYSFAISGWLEPLSCNANMADLDVAGTILLATSGYCCQSNDDTFVEMVHRLMTNDDFWMQSAELALRHSDLMTPTAITEKYRVVFKRLAPQKKKTS